MIYRIFDDMSQCSEQEVARLLPLVSSQRRKQALRYTHVFGQYTCLKSYVILKELLHEWSGEETGTLEFLYNEYGAPYLNNGPYFSISHCKQGIAVVVSDKPVGIDIEGIRRVDARLMRKTMNDAELKMIGMSDTPNVEFIRLWTRKEAYVKMLGTGIISDMHAILSNTDMLTWNEIFNGEFDYICTVVEKNSK